MAKTRALVLVAPLAPDLLYRLAYRFENLLGVAPDTISRLLEIILGATLGAVRSNALFYLADRDFHPLAAAIVTRDGQRLIKWVLWMIPSFFAAWGAVSPSFAP